MAVTSDDIKRWLAASTEWLVTYKDKITTGAAIATAVIALGGFWLTITQLSNTAAALRAANSYQIQKDARELADKIRSDTGFRRALENGPSDKQDEVTFSDDIWKMANFYLSVFRLWKANGISADFYRSYGQYFCGLFGSKYIADEWGKMLASKQLNDAEREMKDKWCTNG